MYTRGKDYLIDTPDTDEGIEQKVKIVSDLIKRDSTLYDIKIIAYQLKGKNDLETIMNVYNLMQQKMKYISDPPDKDLFISAYRQLENYYSMGYAIGDCDDHTIFGGTILKALGFRIRPVTTATMNSVDDSFNHIFLQVYSPTLDKWITFDPVKKTRPLGYTAKYKRIKIYKEI